MRTGTMSRRAALEAGVCALIATTAVLPVTSARSLTALTSTNEKAIRDYYAAWEKKDWRLFDALLTEDFTFTSANNDDHISKGAFKAHCWEAQKDYIERFDLERVFGSGNEAFVMYVGRTTNGKTFRNVEYLRLRNSQVEAIECYFGAQSSFPSAVSARQG